MNFIYRLSKNIVKNTKIVYSVMCTTIMVSTTLMIKKMRKHLRHVAREVYDAAFLTHACVIKHLNSRAHSCTVDYIERVRALTVSAIFMVCVRNSHDGCGNTCSCTIAAGNCGKC
jgi:hypothetical protein